MLMVENFRIIQLVKLYIQFLLKIIICRHQIQQGRDMHFQVGIIQVHKLVVQEFIAQLHLQMHLRQEFMQGGVQIHIH